MFFGVDRCIFVHYDRRFCSRAQNAATSPEERASDQSNTKWPTLSFPSRAAAVANLDISDRAREPGD